jgi:hypothetical protein
VNDLQAGYDLMKRLLCKTPIHPRLRVAHLWHGQNIFCGTGTLVLGEAGGHKGIITASHWFLREHGAHPVSYQVLQPYSEARYPITRVEQLGNEDVAICFPGELAPVGGFSTQPKGGILTRINEGITAYRQPATCMHLLTGQDIPIFGYLKLPGYVGDRFVLGYGSGFGQSGSGFVKENQLYVLQGACELGDDGRSVLGIPPAYENLTGLSIAAGLVVK